MNGGVSMRATAGRFQCLRFTLSELLVVAAVMLLLLAMLMPMFKNVLKHSRRVQCTSHLTQSTLGFFTYIEDFSGWFPQTHYVSANEIHREGNPTNEVWPEYIPEISRIFICPAAPPAFYALYASHDIVTSGEINLETNRLTTNYQIFAARGNYSGTSANKWMGWNVNANSTKSFPRAPIPHISYAGRTFKKDGGADVYVAEPNEQPLIMDGGREQGGVRPASSGHALFLNNHTDGKVVVFIDGHSEYRLYQDTKQRFGPHFHW